MTGYKYHLSHFTNYKLSLSEYNVTLSVNLSSDSTYHIWSCLFSPILFPNLAVPSHCGLLMRVDVKWQAEVKSSRKNINTCLTSSFYSYNLSPTLCALGEYWHQYQIAIQYLSYWHLGAVFDPDHVITVPSFLCKNEVHVLASCLDYFISCGSEKFQWQGL